jgi:hypothetical protein
VWSRQFGAVDSLVRAHGAVNGAVDATALTAASDAMLRLQAWLKASLGAFVGEDEPT